MCLIFRLPEMKHTDTTGTDDFLGLNTPSSKWELPKNGLNNKNIYRFKQNEVLRSVTSELLQRLHYDFKDSGSLHISAMSSLTS